MKRRQWLSIVGVCLVAFCGGWFVRSQVADAPVTREMVISAEKLLGLNFTDAKRDSMLEGLKDQRENFRHIRAVPLTNDIPPAVMFNPLPPDFHPGTMPSRFLMSPVGKVELPANEEALAFMPVTELSALMRDRKITSVALTQLYLKRLKKYGPRLECLVTLTEELALAQAQRADDEMAKGKYRGPLHGIPFGIKDLFATKGIKTTWGSVPFKDQMIDRDATVVSRLEEAGAVLVAKLSMGELAWGDVWFGGKTKNPWNLEEGSSGSSAGSAAATAAGLVGFAIGTETYGSIVSPSTRCGVTGLRPTYGRVSRAGAMALSWSMDKAGPICRSVEDCALVLNAIQGPDDRDQSVIAAPFIYDPKVNLKNLRIGYLKADFDSARDGRANDSTSLVVLRSLGAQLIPLALPAAPVEDLSIILSAEAGAAFDDLTRSGKDDLLVRQIKNAWPNAFRESRFIPAVEYVNANRVRTLLIRSMAEFMKSCDVYVGPSQEGNNLLLTNLTGHPCVVVPNGFTEKGSPTSISFTGRLFEEGTLLAVAKKYQDATGFHKKHPPNFE
jgi:Asp-tRNA(Asn)/Glu-tRNA(Gln) amidotransferase A subunit family amidase